MANNALYSSESAVNESKTQTNHSRRFQDTATVKQIDHFNKIYKMGAFVDFQGNNLDLQKISKVPVAMFVGEHDDLATPGDSEWAKSQIKSVVHYKEIPSLNHGSFTMAKDMSFMNEVLQLVSKYNPRIPASLMLLI